MPCSGNWPASVPTTWPLARVGAELATAESVLAEAEERWLELGDEAGGGRVGSLSQKYHIE